MEQQQKLEIGRRIKWLRDNSAETSRTVAGYCGVSVEAVRNWIAGKGIAYENAEKVATMFGLDVDWVWRGQGTGPSAPDLATLNKRDPRNDQLDRIERAVKEILKRLPEEDVEPTEAADDVPDQEFGDDHQPERDHQPDAEDEDEPGTGTEE